MSQRCLYHGVGDSAATSMTSLALYGDVHHWRIMGRIVTADFILYYCRICPSSLFLFIVVVSFQEYFKVPKIILMFNNLTEQVVEQRPTNDSTEEYLSGPSCSKLTISLVNDTLKFILSEKQICWIFWLKKCEYLLQCKSYSHFFSKKYQNIVY